MSRFNGEKVLVIPRSLFDSIGSFHGVQKDAEAYLDAFFSGGAASFMDREAAELDPSFKQIIPYAVFTHNGKILHYTRGDSGGEARLHDKGSIGIGGHINPVDAGEAGIGLSTYLAGVQREIDEELTIEGTWTQSVIGLLNDDTNSVGAVHLGIIHRFDLSSDQVRANEAAIASLGFYAPDELKNAPLHDKLETWSQLALASL